MTKAASPSSSTRAVAMLMTRTTRCITCVLAATTCSRSRYDRLLKSHSCCTTNHSQWARTPPSASWRFDAGRPGPGGEARGSREPRETRRERSPRRAGSRSPAPRREERRDRDRDYERRDRRDRDRTRSPEDRDRDMKDREREEEPARDRDRERDREYENGANGDAKGRTKLGSSSMLILTNDS